MKIIAAHLRTGYSSVDHMIRGDELASVVGRTFRSRRALETAVHAATVANIVDRRLLGVPARITIATGESFTI